MPFGALLLSTGYLQNSRCLWNSGTEGWSFIAVIASTFFSTSRSPLGPKMSTLVRWLFHAIGLCSSSSLEPDYLKLSVDCVQDIKNVLCAGHELQLNGRQCQDLASKLEIFVEKMQNLVLNVEASGLRSFYPALRNMYRVSEKAKLLVNDCSKEDWCRESMFQIQNEEAFGEILREIGLCDEQAKAIIMLGQLKEQNRVKDLGLPSTISPASETNDLVLEDRHTLKERLQDMAKSSTSSDKHKEYLVRFMLRKLEVWSAEQRIENLDPSDPISLGTISEVQDTQDNALLGKQELASKVQRIENVGLSDAIDLGSDSELQHGWENANLKIIGSGAHGAVLSTKWHGIPCAKKEFIVHASHIFQREAAVLRCLNHPNIAKFFFCGTENQQCFIAMELMHMSLHELIKERKGRPFSTDVAINIILQIANAMYYLHKQGIAHRDLKSLNVVINKVSTTPHPGDKFQVKLVDFGLSKTKVEASRSNPVSIRNCGTTAYRAPEVFSKGDDPEKVVWFKADVYSFALICSAILSLKEPFEGVYAKTLICQLRNGLRPRLPQDCPKELAALVEECWNAEPKLRPSFLAIRTRLEKLVFSSEN